MNKQGIELAVRKMLTEVMESVEKQDAPPAGSSRSYGEGPMEFTDTRTGETFWGMVRVCLAPDKDRLAKLYHNAVMFE